MDRAAGAELRAQEALKGQQGVLAKLSRAAQAYEAQLVYGREVAAENSALRRESSQALSGLAHKLQEAQARLGASRAAEDSARRTTEDALAKMVLMDRALQATQDEARTKAKHINDQAREIKQVRTMHTHKRPEPTPRLASESIFACCLAHSSSFCICLFVLCCQLSSDLVALQEAHSRVVGDLEARDGEVASLLVRVGLQESLRAQTDSRLTKLDAELTAATRDATQSSQRCLQLEEEVIELREQIAEQNQQAKEAAKNSKSLSARLQEAEKELQQHHQLTAMIHKLSGQAAATATAAAATTMTR